MNRYLLALLLFTCSAAHALNVYNACPQTSGTLTLRATIPRTSGISPLTVFFDATGTTDTAITGNTSVFQDVQFTWKFGDTLSSGTGTWQYGSNPGGNSMNTAIGGVAAHMYISNKRDTKYTATVCANNGVTSVCCGIGVGPVYNPNGTNGFPSGATTCIAAASTPVAGAGGCPAGAAVLQTPLLATALGATHLANNKRVLFKCGDTFTGDEVFLTGMTGITVGAYGSPDCSGTQSNRPIFKYSGIGTSNDVILLVAFGTNNVGEARFTDIDMEGNGMLAQNCFNINGNRTIIPYQITMYNLLCNSARSNYYWGHGAQIALINSVGINMQGAIGTFINVDGNGTGAWTGAPINNINYQAIIGNSLAGTGDTSGGGDEAVRISACMFCVFQNNTFKDGNIVGASFKLFQSNNTGSGGSQTNFAGIPIQYVEISDNLFTGMSGGQLVEVSPQANAFDERFYDIVIERNVFVETHDNLGDFLMLSGERETVRDNAFYIGAGFVHPTFFGIQVGERAGTVGCGGPCPTAVQTTQYTELYNNTGYALSYHAPQDFIAFDASGLSGNAGKNSWAKNNLVYSPAGATVVVSNSGTGNTVTNNTTNVALSPGFANGSGTYQVMSDWKPAANYSGGTSVPNWLDALGNPWSPTWDLGAVHH